MYYPYAIHSNAYAVCLQGSDPRRRSIQLPTAFGVTEDPFVRLRLRKPGRSEDRCSRASVRETQTNVWPDEWKKVAHRVIRGLPQVR